MNHVFPTIALRAHCVAACPTSIQRTPILQLFNGYARQRSSAAAFSSSSGAYSIKRTQAQTHTQTSLTAISQPQHKAFANARRAFSSSPSAAARGKPLPPSRRKPSTKREAAKAAAVSPSKLEPATTRASHTEGLETAVRSATPTTAAGAAAGVAGSEAERGAETSADLQEQELTWRDYDPAGGMPLPDGRERSEAEIRAIFGNSNESSQPAQQPTAIDAERGNYILNVMYWRRMSGALLDSGLDFPADADVTRSQALAGLEYVRTLQPNFDEQAAGQVWVEEESLRLQEQIQERALKLGIYKRDDPAESEEEEDDVPEEERQGTAYGRERTGESQLVKIRRANEAAWEREKASREAKAAQEETATLHAQRGPLELSGGVQPATALTTIEGTGISISRPQSKAWLKPVERKPWVKYYEEQATIIKDNIIPQLSLLRRLGPAMLVAFAVVLLANFIAENYTPPPRSARIWPDQPPAVATLSALTATLVGFFIAARLPPMWRTFSKYFTVVPAYPYGISVFGAIFRHDTFTHLAWNVLSLWLFGLILHDDVGRGGYLSIFLAAGTVGGTSSLVYHVLRRNWDTWVFGASGGILGTVGAACVLRPNGTLKIWDREIPMAAWVFAALYAVSETYAVLRLKTTGVDHVGHLGGLVAGMAMAGWLKWKASTHNNSQHAAGGSAAVVKDVASSDDKARDVRS